MLEEKLSRIVAIINLVVKYEGLLGWDEMTILRRLWMVSARRFATLGWVQVHRRWLRESAAVEQRGHGGNSSGVGGSEDESR